MRPEPLATLSLVASIKLHAPACMIFFNQYSDKACNRVRIVVDSELLQGAMRGSGTLAVLCHTQMTE